MKISILMDNPTSWMIPYGKILKLRLEKRGHKIVLCSTAVSLARGDIAFFLSCERIVPRHILARNSHNLVIHESAVPHGKGWSPLTWQILAGKDYIPITLFEAAEAVDDGDIYLQDILHFEGHELVGEIRRLQGEKSIELALKFIDSFPHVNGKKQRGKATFYRKRTPEDSELDINKTIKELFNKLRVIDNKRYPAFFRHKGHTYILKIEKLTKRSCASKMLSRQVGPL